MLTQLNCRVELRRQSTFELDCYLYPVYTIKLARRADYMLAGRASSMFARSCKRGISFLIFYRNPSASLTYILCQHVRKLSLPSFQF